MNSVQKTNGTALTTGQDNYFTSYGQAQSQRDIVGDLLKFSKGDWLAGQNGEEIPDGTRLAASMDNLLIGWIKWEDGKPTEKMMGLVAEGYQPPRRSELGDLDESRWELDEEGQPRDPWQFSNLLIMVGNEEFGGRVFTFTTSSRGGLNAIGELCKVYGKEMRQRPDEYPIVALHQGKYKHKEARLGWIKYPIFAVVGWVNKSSVDQAIANETTAGDEGPDPEPEVPFEGGRGKAKSTKPAAAGNVRF